MHTAVGTASRGAVRANNVRARGRDGDALVVGSGYGGAYQGGGHGLSSGMSMGAGGLDPSNRTSADNPLASMVSNQHLYAAR